MKLKQTLDKLVKGYDKLTKPHTLSYVTTFASGLNLAIGMDRLKDAEYKQAFVYLGMAVGWGVMSYFRYKEGQEKTKSKYTGGMKDERSKT